MRSLQLAQLRAPPCPLRLAAPAAGHIHVPHGNAGTACGTYLACAEMAGMMRVLESSSDEELSTSLRTNAKRLRGPAPSQGLPRPLYLPCLPVQEPCI